jgi:hypothetical protein
LNTAVVVADRLTVAKAQHQTVAQAAVELITALRLTAQQTLAWVAVVHILQPQAMAVRVLLW